jgi:hypothetical protein
MGLMAVALVLNLAPLDRTLSFLTSEKKQVSPVSTGTNEDVFVTETKQIVLKTKVEKRTKVKRTKNADGTSSESKESRLAVEEGVQWITFEPQRAHLDLDVENVTLTGDAADEVTVQRVEEEEGIVFRIAHSYQKASGKRKSGTEKGELRVTALGGFYSLTIPLTISTSYNESTNVTEESAPNQPQPQQPGTPGEPETPDTPITPDTPSTPDTPAPGGTTSEPPQPPTTDTSTPMLPPADTSGPSPPSPEEPGTDSPAPETQEPSPSTPPSSEEPPAVDPAPVAAMK